MGRADEQIAVVDSNNQVMGYKRYDELADSDTWRIVSIWVENSKGEVLLQQRSFKKKLGPGLWTPAVEGTVDGDDDYLSTAIRETEEEIGLTGVDLKPTSIMYYKAEYGSRVVQGYKVSCDKDIDGFIVQKDEVETLVWRNKQEVIEEIKQGDSKYPKSAKVWLKLFNLV